jgi:hypothetical protein
MLSAKELVMDQQARSPDKTTIALGLLAAAMGLFIMLTALGIIAPGGKSATDERWVGLVAGLAFLLGGIAVVIQTWARATPTPGGDLPPGTPTWVRATLYILPIAIVASLATIASWVAFGSGPRSFPGFTSFLPRWLDETAGRTVFGAGAVLTWLILLVMAVVGMRRLRGRKEQ